MCNTAKQAEVSSHTGYFNCYMHLIMPKLSPQQCQCCIFLRNWQHSRSAIGRFRVKVPFRLAVDGSIWSWQNISRDLSKISTDLLKLIHIV